MPSQSSELTSAVTGSGTEVGQGTLQMSAAALNMDKTGSGSESASGLREPEACEEEREEEASRGSPTQRAAGRVAASCVGVSSKGDLLRGVTSGAGSRLGLVMRTSRELVWYGGNSSSWSDSSGSVEWRSCGANRRA